jgi:hypothetical protein
MFCIKMSFSVVTHENLCSLNSARTLKGRNFEHNFIILMYGKTHIWFRVFRLAERRRRFFHGNALRRLAFVTLFIDRVSGPLTLEDEAWQTELTHSVVFQYIKTLSLVVGAVCHASIQKRFKTYRVLFFRLIRKIAKSDYWLRDVRSSAWEQLGTHWTDFDETWYLRGFFSKICLENSSLIKMRQG